jgi:hypothetical protein
MRIVPNPPRFIHSDRNIGFRFIEPQAHFFQLYRKFILLLNNFFRIQDHQNHITPFCNRHDLTASPLALRGPFDDSWQIQKLDFCLVVMNYPWDASQSCKFIGCHLRLGFCEFGKKSGFSYRRKSDHANSG